eukprot:Skav227994  [mRNA]  locus=scaffold390:211632:212992:- [translate_table: standard]
MDAIRINVQATETQTQTQTQAAPEDAAADDGAPKKTTALLGLLVVAGCWMGAEALYEVLKSFDAIVKNVANSYRLQEECDVISLRMAKILGPGWRAKSRLGSRGASQSHIQWSPSHVI